MNIFFKILYKFPIIFSLLIKKKKNRKQVMHARIWWKMNRSSSEACAFKFDSNLDGRNFLVKSLRTSQRVFPYPCLSPFPRLAVPPYTHRPFHLSFLWGRFRLPRLTWMHLSGYSRPSFVSFWTGTMPSLLLSFSPCQFIPLFLPPSPSSSSLMKRGTPFW